MYETMVSHDELMVKLRALGQRFAVQQTERVPLVEAESRVLAKSVHSPFALPRLDNAAVDGFAFSGAFARNHGGRLPIIGRLAAGDICTKTLQEGAWRIFTGAALPPSIDRVAMQEDCLLEGDFVTVPLTTSEGENCRLMGEDVSEGQVILTEGTRLRMMDIASLAALGLSHAEVRRKLSVALLSSGKEIIGINQANDDKKHVSEMAVYDANQSALSAALRHFPANVVMKDHCGDDIDDVINKLKGASEVAHLIISTGGASLGEEDHFFEALQSLGKVCVRRIRVKPGRPLTVGHIGSSLVMSLPGNPVAAMVCFSVYVREAMLAMQTCCEAHVKGYWLPAAFARSKKPNRHEFWRGIVRNDGRLDVYPRDGSGLISSLRESHGLIEVPEDYTKVVPGDNLKFWPYKELI